MEEPSLNHPILQTKNNFYPKTQLQHICVGTVIKLLKLSLNNSKLFTWQIHTSWTQLSNCEALCYRMDDIFLNWKSVNNCEGSLINHRHFMTAAHCLYFKLPKYKMSSFAWQVHIIGTKYSNCGSALKGNMQFDRWYLLKLKLSI